MAEARDGPPRPYVNYIPEFVSSKVGTWKRHVVLPDGIIEHETVKGEKVYSIRFGSTSNARYHSDTIRKFARISESHGAVLRFTNASNIEFVASSQEKVNKIKEEMRQLGFISGGWGKRLWNITSCAGFFHCPLAGTDSPSIAKSLGDSLLPYFQKESLPGKLAIAVSGCPACCSGGFTADLSVVGLHTEIPIVTEEIKACDLMGTLLSCPTGAIQFSALPDGKKTLVIREPLCIGCGICVGVCRGLVFRTPEKTDGHAIIVGGKASSTQNGTAIGRVVVPYLPNDPPRYDLTIRIINRIIDTWKKDARDGERIGTWIGRIGWARFFERTGLPYCKENMDSFDMRALTTLKEGGRN
jgi:sulfite reductase beta subunit